MIALHTSTCCLFWNQDWQHRASNALSHAELFLLPPQHYSNHQTSLSTNDIWGVQFRPVVTGSSQISLDRPRDWSSLDHVGSINVCWSTLVGFVIPFFEVHCHIRWYHVWQGDQYSLWNVMPHSIEDYLIFFAIKPRSWLNKLHLCMSLNMYITISRNGQ